MFLKRLEAPVQKRGRKCGWETCAWKEDIVHLIISEKGSNLQQKDRCWTQPSIQHNSHRSLWCNINLSTSVSSLFSTFHTVWRQLMQVGRSKWKGMCWDLWGDPGRLYPHSLYGWRSLMFHWQKHLNSAVYNDGGHVILHHHTDGSRSTEWA